MILATIRDFREFMAAKKRKREPIRFTAKACGCASFTPRDARSFEQLRASMRDVADWGQASEKLDALERALIRRHGVRLPLPRRVLQNEDRSLSIWWHPGAMARCFPTGYLTTIGGANGVRAKKITRDFLDLLAFHVQMGATV